MNRTQICTACTTGPLCVSGNPKIQHIHSSCPKGYWTQPTHVTWLVGDIALGGITICLKEFFKVLYDVPYSISVASFFKRDPSAFPFITQQRTFVHSVTRSKDALHVVHIISRHPQHTPFSDEELTTLRSAHLIFIHAHGPSSWTLECMNYALSVADPTKCVALYNSEYTRRELHILALQSPHSVPSTIQPPPSVTKLSANPITTLHTSPPTQHMPRFDYTSTPLLDPRIRHQLFRLPITITRSSYTRMEDRKYVLSLLPPRRAPLAPASVLTVPWWIYTGRSSPEKNLDRIFALHQEVSHAVLVLCSDFQSPSFSGNIIRLPWQQDLSRIYNATDIYICASLSEGGPISAAEAMMHGNTVVSTPVGHMTDLPIVPLIDSIPDTLFEPFQIQRTDAQMRAAFFCQQYFSQMKTRDILLGRAYLDG
jgi:glycosyltransferase involved in cell wall biosynthesis